MDFITKILKLVGRIPRGQVATYGQIAAMAASPRAARAVGLVLSKLRNDTKVPWHRCISSRGMISIENLSVPKSEQARRLQKEGIEVKLKNGNYWVDLGKYLWIPERVPKNE